SCGVGDYDNDGYPDLYVTNYRADVLYHNNGDGRFTDVTQAAGIANLDWAAAAAFADYDADGDLDLFVANYVKCDLTDNPICGSDGVRLHCSPDVFAGSQSILYANNGDGTFTDVTQAAGLTNPADKAMGVVWSDYDNDGDIDLFVANDRTADRLYRNNGDNTFTDVALMLGVALSENGLALSSMAPAFGDINNDGWQDLSITNYHDEPNMLWLNAGDGFFTDFTYRSGLGGEGLNYLSWGGDFADLDNDGDLDLFVTNGHMDENVADARPALAYAQPNQVFTNGGSGVFDDVSASAGDGLQLRNVSRGAAFGDFDNDGRLDVLIANCGQSPDLLRNASSTGNHWLTIETVGTTSNRDGIGARVRVLANGVWQTREVRSASSYPCHSDMRLHFGLGAADRAERLEIRWPSGATENLVDVLVDRLLRVTEGDLRPTSVGR
ncbi:MAG: CRTAC1 family protein, partial [Candidatus Poribacteria bacterium]